MPESGYVGPDKKGMTRCGVAAGQPRQENGQILVQPVA